MFDKQESDPCPDDITFSSDDTAAAVPLERVEAEICELAGHLAAATCRFLVLLGDFDARRGWASWEMTSCAAWLSWMCTRSSCTSAPTPLPRTVRRTFPRRRRRPVWETRRTQRGVTSR